MEYRIKEDLGVFIIQVNLYENKGMLWWKYKSYKWYRASVVGGGISMSAPPCKSFKTLEEAKEQVKLFKKPAIYHY
jgi:hypothetical protein